MLQTIGTRLGPAAQHPVGVSLMHRPIAGHAPGRNHSTTTSRPAGKPRGIRNPFRKR